MRGRWEYNTSGSYECYLMYCMMKRIAILYLLYTSESDDDDVGGGEESGKPVFSSSTPIQVGHVTSQ